MSLNPSKADDEPLKVPAENSTSTGLDGGATAYSQSAEVKEEKGREQQKPWKAGRMDEDDEDDSKEGEGSDYEEKSDTGGSGDAQGSERLGDGATGDVDDLAPMINRYPAKGARIVSTTSLHESV